ncbi:hypothetical protein J421_5970 (plasmid) [Gemmatirosa kalamazoonensis]|uniref:Uncharacterized protein n=1 Tax=Gemmatirosa kalamazoonensis TaxID=861299 RepID=W0RT57_9BACT|nr:hypothetical protein [Gemmatirosa kalamazoonensis]AHG93505.1 hypothetical protein J421_5970 [Gemmatirosa kalamazoonensis]
MSEHGSGRGVKLVVAGLVVGAVALVGAQGTRHGRPAAPVAVTPVPVAAPDAPEPAVEVASSVIVNGVALDDRTIRDIERRYGMGVRPGDYWYDRDTGAWGMRGGPARGIIAAGLTLGGRLRADASGGGAGDVTGVFVNGRELHPIDVAVLARIVRQPIVPGRYWVDANGVGGLEGGPAYFNLVALAQQSGGGGQHRCLYCDVGTVGGDGSFTYFIDHGSSATAEH